MQSDSKILEPQSFNDRNSAQQRQSQYNTHNRLPHSWRASQVEYRLGAKETHETHDSNDRETRLVTAAAKINSDLSFNDGRSMPKATSTTLIRRLPTRTDMYLHLKYTTRRQTRARYTLALKTRCARRATRFHSALNIAGENERASFRDGLSYLQRVDWGKEAVRQQRWVVVAAVVAD